MNDDTCAPEKFEDVSFQVRYKTSPCGLKRPIVLWKTHVLDDDDNDRVHFHTDLKMTNNITAAVDPLESTTDTKYKRLIKYIRYQYDQEGLSFSSFDHESEC